MRTDRSAERTVGVSRRAVLWTGGLAAGAGVLGTGRSAASESDEPLRIAATEPYLASVRALLEEFEPIADADVRVELAESGANPIGRADAADVHVSGQPVLAESAGSTGVADVAAVGGWALLASPGEWREPLSRSAVREHWSGDAPVEAWSETDDESLAAAVETDAPAATAPTAAATARTAAASGGSGTDPAVLARGTRSGQYSHGRGGEAYYGVDAAEIEAVPDDAAALEAILDDAALEGRETLDDAVPLARVEYVHVAPDARDDDRVTAALSAYERRAAAASGADASFLDPAVGSADR